MFRAAKILIKCHNNLEKQTSWMYWIEWINLQCNFAKSVRFVDLIDIYKWWTWIRNGLIIRLNCGCAHTALYTALKCAWHVRGTWDTYPGVHELCKFSVFDTERKTFFIFYFLQNILVLFLYVNRCVSIPLILCKLWSIESVNGDTIYYTHVSAYIFCLHHHLQAELG
jgi:hypothetical protein